jgi:hypothetical protein
MLFGINCCKELAKMIPYCGILACTLKLQKYPIKTYLDDIS